MVVCRRGEGEAEDDGGSDSEGGSARLGLAGAVMRFGSAIWFRTTDAECLREIDFFSFQTEIKGSKELCLHLFFAQII
jgi:hypothetical protein